MAEHFNLADHNNIQDMKVSVVKQVNGGTAPRQREERRLIFKLKTLAPSGMNIEFKEARNSFHFPQTSFTNSFPITVWFIVSV